MSSKCSTARNSDGYSPAPSRRANAGPLTGHRAPDLELADGTSLFTALRPGRYVLLGSTGTPSPMPGAVTRAAPRPRTRPAWPTAHTALIRPDGHVARAGDGPDRDPGVTTSP
ncbi:aromatic-ring hydroxylase C-terminal domain-containing protein [Streptomyces pratensis]|uniref:aromatic-ring hydroxylase C-terminal domain-containing protein n=1 Tax=Streptomyces pratensis TaxID=1169025 RepID=UPI00363B8854